MVKVTDGESIFDRTPKNTFKSWHEVLGNGDGESDKEMKTFKTL